MSNLFSGQFIVVPNALQKASQLAIVRNNVRGRVEIVTSRDNGNTFTTLVPEVPKGAANGLVLTTVGGAAEWLAPVTASTSTTTGRLSYADFFFPGELQTGIPFGIYQAPTASTVYCLGLQLSVFSSGSPSSIIVDICDTNGNVQNMTASISAGLTFKCTTFTSPFPMSALSQWRLIITQVGSVGNPGDSLSCRMVLMGA